jgi:hypothetical protein
VGYITTRGSDNEDANRCVLQFHRPPNPQLEVRVAWSRLRSRVGVRSCDEGERRVLDKHVPATR